jgi:hypothetical protein
MSWLFSQALVEEYSRATCSDGEPSARLSVMLTAQPFWRNDKPMDFSRPSLFGLTLRHLTADRGEALLTLFRAGFPARTSALQARATDSRENAAAFGFRWRESFAKWHPATSTWRTRQHSLLGDLDVYSETWPRWGSMRDGESSAQPTPELRTCASESGLWPTPLASDGAKGGPNQRGGKGDLRLSAAVQFPTPQAYAKGSSASRPGLTPLDIAVRPEMARHAERAKDRRRGIPMIPTPTAGDSRSSGSRNTAGSQAHFGVSLTDWVRGDNGKGRISNTEREGLEGCGGGHAGESQESESRDGRSADIGRHWPPEPAVGRVVDGMAHRVDRLRALGNGQVPRVAVAAWRRLAVSADAETP